MVTVIIPTISSRLNYLQHSLKTCTNQDVDKFEIIVSDNSEREAEEYVKSIRDPRIKYVSPGKYLGMSEHWEYAVSQSSGEMVCIIGDDDGLLPGAISRVEEVTREYRGLPIRPLSSVYYWPDHNQLKSRNKVQVLTELTDGIRIQNSRDALKKLAQTSFLYRELPMIYHGFIPSNFLQKKPLFPQIAPDIYSAIAIAAECEKYLMLGEHLTLPGVGAASNGASLLRYTKNNKAGQKFLNESHNLYKSRYNSFGTQFAILDSLLDVGLTYPELRLEEHIAWSKHLAISAFELRKYKTISAVEIFKIACQKKELVKLLLEICSRGSQKIKKIGQSKIRKKKPKNSARKMYKSGDEFQLDESITNIFDASLVFSHLSERVLR